MSHNGTEVTIYEGAFDDTKNSKVVKKYAGSLGLEGHQTAGQQNEKDAGPVPEGKN